MADDHSTTAKTCSKCGVLKPIEDFGKNCNRPSRRSYCKQCDAREALSRFQRDRDAQIKRKRERYWSNRSLELSTKRSYYATHREEIISKERQRNKTEKAKARKALRLAVSRGEVLKPERCVQCLEIPVKGKLHAHHTDYSQPLKVVWLCWKCHGKEHRTNAA